MLLTTDVLETIELARSQWNIEADEHNQWHELDLDEKLNLITKEHRDVFHQALVLLGEAE